MILDSRVYRRYVRFNDHHVAAAATQSPLVSGSIMFATREITHNKPNSRSAAAHSLTRKILVDDDGVGQTRMLGIGAARSPVAHHLVLKYENIINYVQVRVRM